MTRIGVKIQKNDVIIVERQAGKFDIYLSEINYLQELNDDSLIAPQMRKKNVLTYKIQNSITLDKYLNSNVSVHEYYNILAFTVEMIKKIKIHGLRLDNLILDSRYVCIRPITGVLTFIYQPLPTSPIDTDIKSFVVEVLDSLINPSKILKNELDECRKFVERTDNMDYTSLEDFILERYPQIYQQIKRIEFKDSDLQL